MRIPNAFCSTALALLALTANAAGASAQSPPRRLELADTVRTDPRATPPVRVAPLEQPIPRLLPPSVKPAPPRRGDGLLRNNFIRDQTVLGLLVYGPSFAATVTNDPVAWSAAYLVVGGGSYLMASELSRNLTISEPTAWLATQTAIRGGLAGAALTWAGGANRHDRAAGVFFGSVAGTAAAVTFGRTMKDGEVAAATFGSDLSALTGLALTHMTDPEASGKSRAGVTAVAALVGYPLGYLYASTARYRVTPGDVTTLWTSAAIGATAAGAFIVNGKPTAGTIAATLTVGALAGTVLGDRLLVQPFDHTPEQGQMVALAAVGGGLMGAGIGALTGVARDSDSRDGVSRNRMNGGTLAMTAVGAVAGVFFAEQYLHTGRGRRTALGRVEVSPSGALAAASGLPGTHPILRWTF